MKSGNSVKSFTNNKNNQIEIRYPLWSDVHALHTFVNKLSQEDTFVQLSGQEITFDAEMDYVANCLKSVEKNESIHLVALVNGEFAANCSVTKGRYRKSHVGLLAISVDAQFRDQGIGAELINALLIEAKKIGITRIELTCLANNPRAIHLYTSLGFTQVGVVPEAIAYKNTYVDELIFYKKIV